MIIRNKFNGYSGDGRRLYPGGGGGPTQTTSYQTNIPEYARPYVESMLGATQRQVYTGTTGPGGEFQPTGFKEFIPYGSTYQTDAQGNPMRDAQGRILYTSTPQQAAQQAVAPLSTLQQQGLMGLGAYVPPQQGAAVSQIAGDVAGRSAAAGYYSPLVAERFQLGRPQQVYSDSFVAPGVSQAYMSPYMQNVVRAQQREARRASEITRNQQQAQAVGQGAYGGSRQAIVEAERQRNLATQLGDIQAQGLQQAYGAGMGQFNTEQQAYLAAQQANQQANLQAAMQNLQAQQAAQQLQEQSRQFGAGLGIQGYGQTLQAAQMLGQQGAQDFQQDMSLLQAKMQAGGLDQQQQQQVINQALQNYATQQQYPLMQLGVLSNMLRGLPMQAATTQTYQAPLSPISQAAGAIGTGLGLVQQYNQAFPGRKEGGVVKLAPGGIATGVSPGKLADMAEMMKDEDLQKKMQDQQTDPATKEIFQSETMRRQKLRGMAGGGIVAFRKAGRVKEDPTLKQMREEVGGGYTDTSGEKNPEVMQSVQSSAPDVQDMPAPTPPTGIKQDTAPTSFTNLQTELESLNKQRKESVSDVMGRMAEERKQLGIVPPTEGRKKELDERKARIDKDSEEFAKGNLILFLQRWGQIRGDALIGATTAGYEMVERSQADRKERMKMKDALDDAIANLKEADYLRQLGDYDKAQAKIENAGKQYFDVATKLEDISQKRETRLADIEAKKQIQAMKGQIKGASKATVIQVADKYYESDVASGEPATPQTYAAALKRAQDDFNAGRLAAAAISAGPGYARVAQEGTRLAEVDKPKAQAEVGKKVEDIVDERLFADSKARQTAQKADKKAGLSTNDPQSETFKLRSRIRKQVESEMSGQQAAPTSAPKPKESKKEEPKAVTPALKWDPAQKKWVQ